MAVSVPVGLVLSSGTEVDVFDQYTITLDMMAAGNPWTFTMWRSATRQTTWPVLRRELRLGESITVTVNGCAQLTGRIEAIETHGEASGATIVLSGRDLGGAAMSWDADPTVRLRGLSLSDALTALFTPLGIPLVISASAAEVRAIQSGTVHEPRVHVASTARRRTPTTPRRRNPRGASQTTRRAAPVDRSHPQAGEKVWALAEAICRRAGFLLWVAPGAGGALAVVVDTPDFASPDVFAFERRIRGLTATGNIDSGVERLSLKDVPTLVNVYSGTSRGDLVSARQRAQVQNAALRERSVTRGFVDSPPAQVAHHRSTRSRTIAECRREGEHMIAEAMAGFRRYEAKVQGHGQTIGGAFQVYAINTMCRVYDDLCADPEERPLDESMLTTRVQFDGGSSAGQTTALTLVPKDSIVVTPEGS